MNSASFDSSSNSQIRGDVLEGDFIATREGTKSFSNPPSMMWIATGTYIVSLSLFLGVFVYYTEEDSLLIAGIMLAIALYFAIATLTREYTHRPTTIEIMNDGLNLTFRFSKSRLIPWQDIVWVNATPKDKLLLPSNKQGVGMLQTTSIIPYPLTFEAATAIRFAFSKALGRFPPTRDEYRRGRRV